MSASSTAQRPRATRQRAAVADILARTDEFRSAQQIHSALEAEGTKVGLATVYRNLQTLAESGAVDQVRSAEGEVLYRACEEQEHHHHIVCRRCGYTVEVSGGELEEWIQRVSARQGFTQMEHTAEFFGLSRPDRPGARAGFRSCLGGAWRVLHEGRELLKEGRGYST